MLVKMTCHPTEVYDTIEYAESQGLQLHNKTKISRECVELLFSTDGKEVAAQLSEFGAETYLQFEDGSISPLHIRRNRDFSE
jgi:hypothetical protein